MAKTRARREKGRTAAADPMTRVLATFRDPTATGWEDAWAGIEPTFSKGKAVRKWRRMSATPKGEDAYFEDPWVMKTEKRLGRAIAARYERWKAKGRACCTFDRVERDVDVDPWGTKRQNLHFRWRQSAFEDFEVKLGIDPEVFEFSIKPVPIAWFYDDRFVEFLQAFVWDVPISMGLVPTIAHGGGQFSLSGKTFLTGSLLADDLAARLNHPELATWVMDWPNADDRSFRATRPRLAAFRRVIEAYWRGAFHPSATGVPTVLHAFLDRFEPAAEPREGSMDAARGPTGDRAAVLQTNFAFARAVRWRAQNVDPGYWQSAHPKEEGYHPDQVMRYGEVNLNRLQVKGEWHVKRGDALDADRIPAADAPLDFPVLAEEASWEDRGQMSRTSARDGAEAVLLDVHAATYLQKHPHPPIVASLHQDRLLGDAEETLARKGKRSVLARLRAEARTSNREASHGRLDSDWIEPETLFWAAWRALSPGERSEVAEEAVAGFVERVAQASSVDPRAPSGDPMEAHRHRVHPVLWEALANRRAGRDPGPVVRRELDAWRDRRAAYLARRPAFAFGDDEPPWGRA
jgi:hypothetical protein